MSGPAQAFRQAAAVPVLVEILDPQRDGFRKSHCSGDVGAALAAGLDQLDRGRAGGLECANDGAKAFRQPGLQAGVGEDEAERLRQAAVDGLEVALEGQIVGQIEPADAGRIAAAAEILQQQRVVQLPYPGFAQAELAADMDPDPAAAQAVPGRLALDQVERMTERAQQLRQADFLRNFRLRARGNHGNDIRAGAISARQGPRAPTSIVSNRPCWP